MPHAAPAALSLLDPHSLLASAGALGVFLVLFAETGLLIGFFLPGDSLLFTAGLLCATPASSTGHLSLPTVLVAAAAGALIGAETGFLIGRQAGHVLDKPGRPRLTAGVRRARDVMDRYGVRRAIVLARFIPVVRTVINPVAGAAGIGVRTFTVWQVAGGLFWAVGVTLAGFALGSRISSIDHYLLPIIAVIVAVSLIPVAIELLRHRAAGSGNGAGPADRQADRERPS
jgi:membrane-associated protein